VRTQAVVSNQTCNLACTFCTIRRPEEDAAFVAHAAVKARIEQATTGGVEELVITGGEPTMRRDLAVLVRHAKQTGARSVVLETNATLLDEARTRGLREAGLDVARVHVPALGPALADITREPSAPAALERGLRAIVDAGIALDVAIPIVRANRARVGSIPAELAAVVGDRIRTIVLRVPIETADPDDAIDYAEASRAILDVTDAARTRGIAVKLAPDSGPPPCVFAPARRPTQLYSMTGKAREQRRLAACDGCRVDAQCGKVAASYLARFGEPQVSPIGDERTRRRLSIITSVEEQIARELLSPGGRARTEGDSEEWTIRVSFHCNQSCDFCFVSTHLPAPAHDVVRETIERALEKGHRIVLSGGEPTLNARLPEYLRLATRSPHPVELQTNATRLADAELARSLYDAGLRLAFVSLHGATAGTSDRVTRAPGTFDETVRGIDHLHALGVEIRLNFVICRTNAAELPAMVDLIAERWPRASLTVSFVAHSTDVVPRDRELMPRYAEIVPYVTEALARSEARGISVHGFESMCGMPLCLVPSEKHFALPEIEADQEFHHPAPCDGCALRSRCFGVRRGYVELHGFDELQPVAAR
jgi:MoaA/NifB/PqqE/SkfB family radical SAM enzyme